MLTGLQFMYTIRNVTQNFPRPSFHCQYITGLTGSTENNFIYTTRNVRPSVRLCLRKSQIPAVLYANLMFFVTVHHWYNNINSQLDATIINFIDNYNQLNMFRVIVSPILMSTRL